MLALTIQGSTEYLDETNQESAMERYWKACASGDATAKLIKTDGPPTEPEPPRTPPAAPGQVSELARARALADQTTLTKEGFALEPPIYAHGTRVLPLGDTNFRLERQRVESLPTWNDAANRIVGQIDAERRQDVTLNLHELHVTNAGPVDVQGQPCAMTESAFFQLLNLLGLASGARYLARKCDSALRAHNVNLQALAHKNRLLTVRTRTRGGARQIYAVVTPRYAVVDTNTVLKEVGNELADARVEMVYDGSGVRATALFMPDEIVDLGAGDIFKVGVRIETDDTGGGRIRVSAVAFRNRCLNLIVIGESEVETLSAVHKGPPGAILATVKDAVSLARAKVSTFLERWGYARTVKIDVKQTLIDWLDAKKLVPISPNERDRAVEALLTAWQAEPGDTLADAVNAVTRSAHESDLWTPNFRAELEKRAARLVLVPR